MSPKCLSFLGAACTALAPLGALAATLTTVPMQGGMAMPMISYHAEHGHLRVTMPADLPQLTPLLVSHPGDSFDPADPWYNHLDPARGGLSFSRRYGFVMDALSDPLPADTAIWLEKTSGPQELNFYRYAGSSPKAWQPIFGTAGSPAAMAWNGMMFHPAVTAPPGTNGYTATFEAYLVNTTTGAKIEGSGSGPMLLVFTNVPDGRPTLAISTKIAIAWPASPSSYVLQQADALPATAWTDLPVTPVLIDGLPTVLLEPDAATRFFRLRPAP